MNKLIPALLLVIVVILGFIVFAPKNAPSKDEALRFVNEDLEAKYPGTLHEIISAEKEGANWKIKARVTFDYGTACPSRLHATYKYPEFGYVAREEEWITKGRKFGTCEVCIGLPADKCLLFFEEEAVIASHTRLGAEQVSSYVSAHPDAVPTAQFYNESIGYPPDEPVYYDVWLVNWESADNSTLNVLLNKEQGTIIKVWGTG